MKAEFEFDGEALRINLRVEDRCEIALAKVMEKYNRATVSLTYPQESMFHYNDRDTDPRSVSIVLREAVKCAGDGGWCEYGCDSTQACKWKDAKTLPCGDKHE